MENFELIFILGMTIVICVSISIRQYYKDAVGDDRSAIVLRTIRNEGHVEDHNTRFTYEDSEYLLKSRLDDEGVFSKVSARAIQKKI